MSRCTYDTCHYKLDLVEQSIICKCKKTYCKMHRAPEAHQCKFDYRAEGKENLQKAMPTVTAKKVDVI